MKGRVENFTPHSIHIYSKNDLGVAVLLITLEPDAGGPMRLTEHREDWVGRVPIEECFVRTIKPAVFSGVENLPQTQGLNVVVSALVAEFLVKHHADHFNHIYSPDTGPGGVVRDERGQIKGTLHLIQYK
jgi:hypothetical protein